MFVHHQQHDFELSFNFYYAAHFVFFHLCKKNIDILKKT